MKSYRLYLKIFCVCFFLMTLIALTFNAFAEDTNEEIIELVKQFVPHAEMVGSGTMTYLFWDVYDAYLIAPYGQYNENEPFALKLDYKRHIDGSLIADTSANEIKRQGFRDKTRLEKWHQEMLKLFTNVEPQTNLVGIYQPQKPTCFFRNKIAMGCIKDPQFGLYFFRIWLGVDTVDPDLRKALLGQP